MLHSLVLVLAPRIELAPLVVLNRWIPHLVAVTGQRMIVDSLPGDCRIPVALKNHHPEVRIRRLAVAKNLPLLVKSHRLAQKIPRLETTASVARALLRSVACCVAYPDPQGRVLMLHHRH